MERLLEALDILLKIYDDKAMGCAPYFEWHGCFKSGRTSWKNCREYHRRKCGIMYREFVVRMHECRYVRLSPHIFHYSVVDSQYAGIIRTSDSAWRG